MRRLNLINAGEELVNELISIEEFVTVLRMIWKPHNHPRANEIETQDENEW
jgi:hypothetical protein